MIRIAILSTALLLTACGHYQHLEQNNQNAADVQSSQTNNRYSQNNVLFNNEKSVTIKSEKSWISSKPKEALTLTSVKNKTRLPEKIVPTKNTAIITDIKGNFWHQLVKVFTPEKVKPWQKSNLAKATMKPGGLTPGSEKFNQKIYSSKESSRGGLGVAGGGCGCN